MAFWPICMVENILSWIAVVASSAVAIGGSFRRYAYFTTHLLGFKRWAVGRFDSNDADR
jgi:hypothetical protein